MRFTPEKKAPLPVVPDSAKDWRQLDVPTNPVVAVCGDCKVELRRLMWFYCDKPACPHFTQATFEDDVP